MRIESIDPMDGYTNNCTIKYWVFSNRNRNHNNDDSNFGNPGAAVQESDDCRYQITTTSFLCGQRLMEVSSDLDNEQANDEIMRKETTLPRA